MPGRAELVTDFLTGTNAVATNYFLGKVGVGTARPEQKLDVTGNLRVTATGTFAAVLVQSNLVVAGALAVSNGMIVSGPVAGLTAAKLGAVSVSDARYLAALTNAAAFDPAGAAAAVQASLATLPSGISGATATQIVANVLTTGTVATARMAQTLTGAQAENWNSAYAWGNHAAAGYATAENLSRATNAMPQALLNVGPYGDLSMGSFTNRAP
jgi:hypothetical protein